MTEQDHDDLSTEAVDELTTLLRAAYDATDPVPESLLASQYSFVRWASPDAGLAELRLDEYLVSAAVRGSESGAELDEWRFELDALTIEMGVYEGALAGSVRPWSGGSIAIDHDGPHIGVTVDDDGEFTAVQVPVRPFRLRLDLAGSTVVTEFVQVAGR